MQNARLQLGQLLRRKPLERLRNLLAEITVHFLSFFRGDVRGFIYALMVSISHGDFHGFMGASMELSSDSVKQVMGI